MQIGIFSRTYETGDLRETFKQMRAHGISHTQFNFSNAGLPTLPDEIGSADTDRIRALALEYGISLDALSGTFNMIDPDEEARAQGCRQFAVQCRAARELGIPVVSLCTGSRNPVSKWAWHDDNLTSRAWDDLMRSTLAILKHADDNDVILGVEPEASNIINTPERAREYLDAVGSPRLKIIMDGANLFQPGQSRDMEKVLTEAFALLGRDIVLAHAKDLAPGSQPAFTAVGQGILNFALYMKLLRRYGYDGPLIMHGLTPQQVPESKRFLESIEEEG